MNRRTLARRLGIAGVTALALPVVAGAAAFADSGLAHLGFTPLTNNALSCSTTGQPVFAPGQDGPALVKVLMSAGDPATLVNAPATSTKVGTENDMIALSPDGRYLFTPSEAGASDGITRLTLKGDKAGTKELLAQNVDSAGKPVWSRVDGMKWYPYGGPRKQGVLLASEEFNDGGVWQINPDTGAFVRLSWIGNYAHEGIGLDKAGNLYLGDENRGGAIYKAVPNDPSDLTKGGTLYYMVGTGTDASGWKKVVDPAKALSEAGAGGAVLFDRPEDFDERNGRVYFTVTEPLADAAPRKGLAGQLVNEGGVYSVNTTGVPDLAKASGSLPYNRLTPMIKLNDPKFTTQAEAQAQQGLQFPDNIAFDRFGNLWVHEDIPDSDGTFPASGVDVGKQTRDQQDELYVFDLNKAGDAIVANPDTSGPGVSGGYKAADMRTSALATPCQNEFTGGIFGRNGTFYINQQHADNPTLAVTFNSESEGDS